MARFVEIEHSPAPIVTLAKAKKQCRIESDYVEEDDLIQDYIDAAIVIAESKIFCAIKERKYRVTGKSFQDVLAFSKQKIKAIDAFTYKDESGDVQALSEEAYALDEVDKYEAVICYANAQELPKVQPFTQDAVTVDVTVGYKNTTIPKDIKQAVLLLVSEMFEKRMNFVQEKSTVVDNLLQKHIYYRVDE